MDQLSSGVASATGSVTSSDNDLKLAISNLRIFTDAHRSPSIGKVSSSAF